MYLSFMKNNIVKGPNCLLEMIVEPVDVWTKHLHCSQDE